MAEGNIQLIIRSDVRMVHQPREQFYRFQETMYSEAKMMLNMMAFVVIKHTPCGVWIDHYGSKKFVNTNARKRYAWATKEEALESFHARKRKQARLLRWQLKKAEAALKLNLDNLVEWIFTTGDL